MSQHPQVGRHVQGGVRTDQLYGEAGNDVLIGGAGDFNTLVGGTGDDTYRIDRVDTIVENAGEGTDAVYTSVDFTLAAGLEVETLGASDVAATSALHLTGNEFAQQLIGNAGNNVLDGRGGADAMIGGAGNDLLNGGAGNDVLVLAPGFGRDTVTGFDANPTGGQDLIDLSLMGVTAATFSSRVLIGAQGTSAVVTVDGNSITLSGIAAAAINQSDFILMS